jgi:hypothetical protein
MRCLELEYTLEYTYRDVRRLTMGILSEKYVFRQFHCCVNVIECTCTNLDSTVYDRSHPVVLYQYNSTLVSL